MKYPQFDQRLISVIYFYSNQVAKERLAMFKPQDTTPVAENIATTDQLINLIKIRENTLFMGLGKALKAAGREGLFETWMLQQNEGIQVSLTGCLEQAHCIS